MFAVDLLQTLLFGIDLLLYIQQVSSHVHISFIVACSFTVAYSFTGELSRFIDCLLFAVHTYALRSNCLSRNASTGDISSPFGV